MQQFMFILVFLQQNKIIMAILKVSLPTSSDKLSFHFIYLFIYFLLKCKGYFSISGTFFHLFCQFLLTHVTIDIYNKLEAF